MRRLADQVEHGVRDLVPVAVVHLMRSARHRPAHQCGTWAARSRGARRPRRQIAERPAVDDPRHRVRDLLPELPRSWPSRRRPRPAARASNGALRPLHRPQHAPTVISSGALRQMVAAGRAPLGGQQARPLEREQHLLEVALGDGLARGDLLDRHQGARSRCMARSSIALIAYSPLAEMRMRRPVSAGGCRARAAGRRPWRSR